VSSVSEASGEWTGEEDESKELGIGWKCGVGKMRDGRDEEAVG
jgi:hypothetical protein